MRRALGKKYLYQKPYFAFFQGVIDSVGYSIFRKSHDKKPPSQVKKILVSRIDHLGDVFIASAILPHIARTYPGAKIHFLGGEWAWNFLRSNRHIDRVLTYNSINLNRSSVGLLRKTLNCVAGFFRNIKEMRSESYDLCVDLRAYPINSIPLLWLGGGKYIAGFSTGGFGFLLDKTVPYRTGVHESAHLIDMLESLGIKANEDDIRPEFRFSEATVKESGRILEGLGVSAGEPFILLHTGSGSPMKLWRKERWQELIDLINHNHRIKTVVYDNIYGDLNGCITLPSLISLEIFAAVAKKAALFIGLDSLPAHLSASFGIPVVTVWCGINDSVQWRPLGDNVSVVKKDLNCSPCLRKRGCRTMECMDISADECMKEVSRLLALRKHSRARLKLAYSRPG